MILTKVGHLFRQWKYDGSKLRCSTRLSTRLTIHSSDLLQRRAWLQVSWRLSPDMNGHDFRMMMTALKENKGFPDLSTLSEEEHRSFIYKLLEVCRTQMV